SAGFHIPFVPAAAFLRRASPRLRATDGFSLPQPASALHTIRECLHAVLRKWRTGGLHIAALHAHADTWLRVRRLARDPSCSVPASAHAMPVPDWIVAAR